MTRGPNDKIELKDGFAKWGDNVWWNCRTGAKIVKVADHWFNMKNFPELYSIDPPVEDGVQEVRWRIIEQDGFPKQEDFPDNKSMVFYVARYCIGQPEWQPEIKYGVLQYMGGDMNRPYWADHMDSTTSLEDRSHEVLAWCEVIYPPFSPLIDKRLQKNNKS